MRPLKQYGWAAFDSSIALAIAALPRSRRFAAAKWAARTFESFFARIPLDHGWIVNRRGDLSLSRVLFCLRRRNVLFTPSLTVRGAEALPEGGALLLSCHFQLNALVVRWLHDHGRRMTIARADTRREWCPIGTRDFFGSIRADARLFFGVRRHVKAGETVFLNIDGRVPKKGRLLRRLPAGDIYFSTSAIEVAVRAGIPIAFCATHLDDRGEVVATIRRPVSSDVEGIFEEFFEMVREEAAPTPHDDGRNLHGGMESPALDPR